MDLDILKNIVYAKYDMVAEMTHEKFKEDLIIIYRKYFGSITAANYKKFYADKDIKTVVLSAEELMIEYAGEAKGKQIIISLTQKYSIQISV